MPSRLAEIYRQEKKTGGSLGSAVGKSIKEKIDPRQIIDPKGIIATLFPSLKAYRATPERGLKSSTTPQISDISRKDFSELSGAMRLTAKNTLSIPMMARDINLIKSNIFKMTRALGQTPETKRTDIFWKNARERENMLESAMGAVRKTSGFLGLSPTTQKQKRDGQTKKTALFVNADLSLQDMATQSALGSAAAGGAAGGVLGKLKSLLPFVFKAALPVLGIAGIASLLYFLIRKDSGEPKTVEEIQSGGGYTPDMGGVAGPVAEPATKEELNTARENMRKSDDPAVRAAAAKLDRQDAIKALPDQSEAESRRLELSSAPKTPTPITPEPTPPTPTPVTENIPSNVVRSGSGEPIRTGSGGFLTSGEDTFPTPVPTTQPAPSPTPEKISSTGPSEQLVNFLKQKENPKLAREKGTSKAWWDYKQWSIGYGTKAKSENETITEAEAEKRLREELEKSQKYVVSYGQKKGYNWNQGQIDALTSFVYNLGPGQLNKLTDNGKRTNEEIAKKLTAYNKAGGKELKGLTERRNIEQAMFSQSPSSSTTPSVSLSAPTSGPSVSTASFSVSDGQRQVMAPSGGGNTVIDNSTRTTVASPDRGGGRASSTYDEDLIRTLVATAA